MTLRKRFAWVAVLAVTSLFVPLTGGATTAHADRTITLTFVRGGESTSNAAKVVDTSIPGPALTPLGHQQAVTAANQLRANGYDGIYVSSALRSQQTAAPLATALGMQVSVLPGLREVEAGQYEGQPVASVEQYETMAWLRGDRSVRIPGSVTGDEFNARFGDAVQAIYDSGKLNPIAFSQGTATMIWVLTNVDNPDNSLFVNNPIPNTGRIVVVGSPQGGWTLKDWNGMPR
jgi:broad specificity phosphatase PhoE